MVINLCIKFAFAIAKMSKRASTIFISVLTFAFLSATALLTVGLIYYNPGGEEEEREISLPLLIVGCVVLFLILLTIAITAISSNYVKRNPEKDPKKNPTKKEE